MADFALVDSPKLISLKILSDEKILKFHPLIFLRNDYISSTVRTYLKQCWSYQDIWPTYLPFQTNMVIALQLLCSQMHFRLGHENRSSEEKSISEIHSGEIAEIFSHKFFILQKFREINTFRRTKLPCKLFSRNFFLMRVKFHNFHTVK